MVGTHDAADDIAVRLGAKLWLDKKRYLTAKDLEEVIYANRNQWTRRPIDFVNWAKSRFKGTDAWEFVKGL